MNCFILLTFCVLATTLGAINAQPTDSRADVVEIVKQRLIKFPEDADRQNDDSSNADKNDEAKRILEEIEKINKALGYKKKQPEQSKLPPILDSSQYLFPKPAYHPFHAQNHQFSGSEGQTLLVPSIRAVRLNQRGSSSLNAFNVPPKRWGAADYLDEQNLRKEPTLKETHVEKPPTTVVPKFQYFFRPNEVHVPPPQSPSEQQQLPAHFVIPVRLYKMNKEQYLREVAPQEFRVKGYKIIGDIDSFYGKAKAKQTKQGKSTPKYHLFFLPRELALNENGKSTKKTTTTTLPPKAAREEPMNISTQDSNSSREEKLASRPFKIQATASSVQTNQQTGAINNSSTTTQVVRKRIVPKPLRKKETHVVSEVASPSQQSTLSSVIRITPPPMALSTNTGTDEAQRPNRNKLTQLNPLNAFQMPNLAEMQANTSTAIKNAFQNIFKFPFRPSVRPDGSAATTQQMILESVPLQSPNHQFNQMFNTQTPQPIYTVVNNEQDNQQDYKWDDDYSDKPGLTAASSIDSIDASDSEAVNTDQSAEKHIFGNKPQQMLSHLHTSHHAHRDALREGGIVIQRLKVRKGGIAIAGPGGVATAGSGGTAIVGPGGYALTHPRSLTIAGPGAKVIAIPSSVDLRDALQRTNLREQSFPREGKIVAEGPTVYYAPPTGTSLESDT